ncbi:hypothetical protein SODALDRAFT_329332 [Sodiomyces alkalinus F11]|uniref:Uncharacterized protein n=1 Tax=Sodiomyces alkalinus (strain CBS 110278 / VKM F-3762 / F11) TaxID=1314773 RepID=A0A3N2PL72_SODAK|nr:hypothetical protein SODALDRAFT_329332 [Sodiomyces alkalinus F11]ROT35154.1 hypothetical protein SODALDRAFT_329332 [Sodiomyces alkalinus F11]
MAAQTGEKRAIDEMIGDSRVSANMPAMTGEKRTFEEMFGGSGAAHLAEVDYSIPEGGTQALLPLPESVDSLEVTVTKMKDLARVVEQGKSLAIYTGYRRDPVQIAKMAMTPFEKKQYEAWVAGAEMAAIDWEGNKKDVPRDVLSQVRFSEYAAAMDEIWGHEGATPENAAWLASEMTHALPLLSAISKVSKTCTDLASSTRDLDEMEVKTAHTAVAVAMDNMTRVFTAMRKMSATVNRSKDILQAREHEIKARMPGYKRR